MKTSVDAFALYLQFASCLYMAGVISVIQLIHYPSFIHINREQFPNFHQQHSKALGIIAGPAMCIELFSALWLARSGLWFFTINVAAVGVLWFLTFFISVPSHNQLTAGFDQKAWERLVKTNWFRSFLWCGRALLLLGLLIYLNKGLP